MVGWIPRVKGDTPGKPSRRSGSRGEVGLRVQRPHRDAAPGLKNTLALTPGPSRLEDGVLPLEERLHVVRFSFLHRDGRQRIRFGAHRRSISLCHERANSVAGVRKLCNTRPAMALPVTTSLVEDSAAALAAGGWRYTQRQLYYATMARAETTPSDAASNGEIGLGVLLILIGLILIGLKVLFALFVTLGVALILAGILGRIRRPRLMGRVLALSFDEFRTRFGALAPEGLIPSDGLGTTENADAPTTIVTDSSESAAVITANAERAELGARRGRVRRRDGWKPRPATRVSCSTMPRRVAARWYRICAMQASTSSTAGCVHGMWTVLDIR